MADFEIGSALASMDRQMERQLQQGTQLADRFQRLGETGANILMEGGRLKEQRRTNLVNEGLTAAELREKARSNREAEAQGRRSLYLTQLRDQADKDYHAGLLKNDTDRVTQTGQQMPSRFEQIVGLTQGLDSSLWSDLARNEKLSVEEVASQAWYRNSQITGVLDGLTPWISQMATNPNLLKSTEFNSVVDSALVNAGIAIEGADPTYVNAMRNAVRGQLKVSVGGYLTNEIPGVYAKSGALDNAMTTLMQWYNNGQDRMLGSSLQEQYDAINRDGEFSRTLAMLSNGYEYLGQDERAFVGDILHKMSQLEAAIQQKNAKAASDAGNEATRQTNLGPATQGPSLMNFGGFHSARDADGLVMYGPSVEPITPVLGSEFTRYNWQDQGQPQPGVPVR